MGLDKRRIYHAVLSGMSVTNKYLVKI